MIEQHDEKTRRCPILGHDIAFAYCRVPGREIPCPRIFDCWWEWFDIKAFMDAHYDRETIAQVLAPPKPKMLTLCELIDKAKGEAGSPQGL